MKIRDFPLLFNDDDFPIRWKREYLRLLTTFEVAVEFKQGRLLIPSHLPPEKPKLPQCIPPDNTVCPLVSLLFPFHLSFFLFYLSSSVFSHLFVMRFYWHLFPVGFGHALCHAYLVIAQYFVWLNRVVDSQTEVFNICLIS